MKNALQAADNFGVELKVTPGAASRHKNGKHPASTAKNLNTEKGKLATTLWR